jgi:hypothetical protein
MHGRSRAPRKRIVPRSTAGPVEAIGDYGFFVQVSTINVSVDT